MLSVSEALPRVRVLCPPGSDATREGLSSFRLLFPCPHSDIAEVAMPLPFEGEGERGDRGSMEATRLCTHTASPRGVAGPGHRGRAGRLRPVTTLGRPSDRLLETSALRVPSGLRSWWTGLSPPAEWRGELTRLTRGRRAPREHPAGWPGPRSGIAFPVWPSSFRGVNAVMVPRSGSTSERQVPGPRSRKSNVCGLRAELRTRIYFSECTDKK